MTVSPFQAKAIAVILLALDVALWGLVSTWEWNASIVVVHLLMLLLCIQFMQVIDRSSINFFSVALLPSSLLSVLAWYSAFDNERKFYIGTNDDPAKYWEAAMLPLDQARVFFEDPFFAILNVIVTDVSKVLAEPSYLATMQTVLFSGPLMAVFAYALAKDLYGERVGKWTGYLMAISPSAITFSTGLLRDSMIGMFGFLFLLAFNRAVRFRGFRVKLVMCVFLTLSAVALAFLRSISLAGFAIAGLLMLFCTTPRMPNKVSGKTKLVVAATLALILTLAVIDRPDRFQIDRVLAHAIASRAGEEGYGLELLNPDGITTKIAEISPLLFILISPHALIQPIPFWAWEAPDYIGGPPALMDVVLGIGGLFNQLLFGFYIVAARHWILTKDTFGVRICLVYTLLVCTLTMVGLGSTRMVMAHCFPFYYLGVGLAISEALNNDWARISKSFLNWTFALLALYASYFAYRELGIAVLAAFGLAIAGFFAVRVWRYGPNWAIRRQGRTRDREAEGQKAGSAGTLRSAAGGEVP